MARVRFLMVVGVVVSVLVLLIACVGTVSANGNMSCDDQGDTLDEFKPMDFGGPNEVYIQADGLSNNAKYDVWIVEYKEGVVACPWQLLDKLGGVGFTGVVVETDGSGTIKNAPVLVWTVPNGTGYVGNYYEIVLDKHPTSSSVQGNGIFDEDDDVLDAIDISEPGFKVMPELPTVLLLGLGLVGVGTYFGIRRYSWRKA
ncbi:MAG: hypothetical protein SVY53_00180 [Chloroflexota bacterium]|nr:hypothetical protein [Chloroflexota bacterium]